MARRLWWAIGGAALLLPLCGGMARAQARGCPPIPQAVTDSTVFLSCQVEAPARLLSAGTISMPSMLRSQGVQGRVAARLVVDTAGRVDAGSVQIRESTHQLFSTAVRWALLRWRFEPARRAGRPVPVAQDLLVEFQLHVGRWDALAMGEYRQVVDTLAADTLRAVVGLPLEGPAPEPLGDAEHRTTVLAMLRALIERAAGARRAAGPTIVCLGSPPYAMPGASPEAGAGLPADPDAAVLDALQIPGVAVLHRRRCPPTHSSMVLKTDEQGRPIPNPPGEDPMIVSLSSVVVEVDGRVYATGTVSQGTGTQGYVCVVERDGAGARCAPSGYNRVS